MLHPRGNPLQHDADFVIERVPLVGSVEDAIEEQQSAAKALDDGHASRPPVTDTGSPRAVTAGSPGARARTRRAPRAPARDPTPDVHDVAGKCKSLIYTKGA
jgi:hypothetical protein